MKLTLWPIANDLRIAVKTAQALTEREPYDTHPTGPVGQTKLDNTNKVRLMVVDDHEVIRNGLTQFLSDALTEVIAKAADASEAVQLAVELGPDAILMDIRMAEFDGLWLLEKMKSLCPSIPVVMLSSYDNPTYIARAIALGASDYLLKNSSRQAILDSVRRGIAGQPALPDSLLERVRRSMESGKRLPAQVLESALTQREAQVLRHIGLGLSNKEIAKSLRISVETVKEHVQNILRKTKATDRTDAAVKAVRWGLVD